MVAPAVKSYVVDLVRATRDPAAYGLVLAPLIELGASPRSHHRPRPGREGPCPAPRPRLRHASRRKESLARDILRHRILVSYEADAEGLSPDDILRKFLDRIPVP